LQIENTPAAFLKTRFGAGKKAHTPFLQATYARLTVLSFPVGAFLILHIKRASVCYY